MALVDDFARHAQYGHLPAGMASAITADPVDQAILERAVEGHDSTVYISAALMTSLNTLFGVTRTTTQWQTMFRHHRLFPVT